MEEYLYLSNLDKIKFANKIELELAKKVHIDTPKIHNSKICNKKNLLRGLKQIKKLKLHKNQANSKNKSERILEYYDKGYDRLPCYW